MTKKSPILVVEDDVWARLIAVVLDPATSAERTAAFADFMSPDEPDFHAWCERARQGAGSLAPSEVRLVSSQARIARRSRGCRRCGDRIARRRSARAEPGAASQGRSQIRRHPSQHRPGGVPSPRHRGSRCAPARQYRMRRARLCVDADTGATAAPADRVDQHRAACGGRASLQAVRPQACSERQLGPHPRNAQPVRQHDRDHRPRRDRPRAGVARRRLRNENSLLSAHPSSRDGGKQRCRPRIGRWMRCSRKAIGSFRSSPAIRRPCTSSIARAWRR